MITRCPACATLFRVVPDQLRIAEGWVRCGRCSEVFDANEHLLADGGEAPAPLSAPDAGHEAPVALPEQAAGEPPEPGGPAEEPQPHEAVAAAPDATGPMPVDILLDDTEPELPASPARADSVPSDAAPPVPDAAPVTSTELVPAGSGPEPANEPAWYAEYKRGFDQPPEPLSDDELSGPELDELSFVREARSRAFWDSPAVRTVLVLLALILLLLLAAQVALYWRDRLAAMQPALRPVLELLCRPSGCVVGTPRQIEAVVIDSSSFNRLGPDSYRLSLTLRNRSVTEVALPSIELTLTDASEQALVRRVLSPQDLRFTAPAVISPGSERSTTVDLSLGADPLAARVAGYRLLAFYP